MSDTPRTDAESGTALDWPYYAKVVPDDFARQLERELAAATERIAALERERDALKRLVVSEVDASRLAALRDAYAQLMLMNFDYVMDKALAEIDAMIRHEEKKP